MDPAAYQRHRCATDPAFLINERMRNAIKKALRGRKAGRKWETLVGYSLAELVERLAETMPPGYSLADFGGGRLHIDHIVPKYLFDVTDVEGLRAAWALSNLQTLTARDNLRKGRRLVDRFEI